MIDFLNIVRYYIGMDVNEMNGTKNTMSYAERQRLNKLESTDYYQLSRKQREDLEWLRAASKRTPNGGVAVEEPQEPKATERQVNYAVILAARAGQAGNYSREYMVRQTRRNMSILINQLKDSIC